MQVGVRVRCSEEVAPLEKLTVTDEAGLEPRDAGLVDALGGQPDGQAFEHGARLQNLDRLLVRDAPHARAPMRLADDQSVLLEADERRANGAPGHRERRREFGLDESSIRSDVTPDDGLAEGVVARRNNHHAPGILRIVAKIVNDSVFMSAVARRLHVVAVLGLGEAGSRLASDLACAGVEVRGYDPDLGRGVPSISRASDAASAAAGCDVVLSVNSARVALEAAEAALPALGKATVYADANTTAPELKRELAKLVAGTGAPFADVALLGPVPERGIGAPVLVSGAGARAFADLFGRVGMPVEIISDAPGDAAALKLVRSVFMKGLAAAVVESMQAAEAVGREEWVANEIEAMIGRRYLERALAGSRTHAVRRVDEMEAARDLLLELGVEPHVATASAAQLTDLAATRDR